MAIDRESRRILLIGTDGLRPDLVDFELMPTYARLITRGTRLRAHHSVFPSITRAIISSINTGCTPGKHGLISGSMRVDSATENHIVNTAEADDIAALDALTGGRAIMQPTLADLLERHGIRMAVAGAQTSGGGALWARKQQFPMVNTTTTYGRADLAELWDRLGGPPPAVEPTHRNPQDLYAARAVADLFLDDGSIRVIAVWLAEPDMSQHKIGLGSPGATESLRVCDQSLAHILDGIDRRGLQDQFDIMLISDHGHSTVVPQEKLAHHLERARQELGDQMPRVSHTSDNIYPMPNEPAPDAEALAPLVNWLQEQPWLGALFGGSPEIAALPGVFSLADAWNGSFGERTPLLAISAAWSDEPNEHGIPGKVKALVSPGGPPYSTHGSTSPYEMHAFASFTGPDFREDVDSELPSGAVDLTPTILHLLGLEPPEWMDGRVLRETLREKPNDPPEAVTETIHPATPHQSGFSPTLTVQRVGHTTYVDQTTNGRSGT